MALMAPLTPYKLRSLLLRSLERRCPSAPPSRSYFVGRPVPNVNRDDIHALTNGAQSATRKGANTLGPRLSNDELQIWNAAKRQGYVAATNISGQSVFNTYYKYCWAVQRPYIAIDRQGTAVFIDATPVLSLNRELKGETLAAVLKAFNTALGAPEMQRPADGQLQVVKSESLQKQTSLTMPGPLEGSNAQKVADRSVSDVCTVVTSSRDQAMRVAQGLYITFCSTTGARTPAEVDAAKVARAASKRENKRRVLLRKLRALVADDTAVRQLRVAGGAIDGFRTEDKAGRVME